MAKIAGLHLASDRFVGVVVEGSAKRWKIIGAEAGEIAAPEEGEDPIGPATVAVAGLLKRIRAPHDPLVLAVSSSNSVFRKIQLPFTGDEAIRKVLKFESESQFHQFNIDDVVVTHVTVEERKGATDLIVSATPKKTLRAQIDVLDRGGYDPIQVDLDAHALFNVVLATSHAPETGSVLVLHVGRSETLLLVIEDRRLVSARSMRTGLATLSQAVAEDLGVPEKDAQNKVKLLAEGAGDPKEELIVTFDEEGGGTPARAEIEKSSGELEHDLVEGRREEIVHRLQREVTRTTAAEARHGLQEVLLCGEGATLAGLQDAIGSATGAPVREADLLEAVEGAPTDALLRRRLPIAVGASLKSIGIDFTDTDLRQEELRFAKKLESLKVPLAALVGVVTFAILLWNIYVFRETGARSREIENYAEEARARLIAALPDQKAVADRYATDPPEERIRLYQRYVEGEIRKLKEMFGAASGASFAKPQSSFEATHRMFKLWGDNANDLGLFVLDKLTTSSVDRPSPQVIATISMTFLGPDAEDCSRRIERLRALIKAEPWCVENVPVASTKPVPGGLSMEGLTIRMDLAKENAG